MDKTGKAKEEINGRDTRAY